MFKKKLSSLAVAAVVCASTAYVPTASADTIQLGFILDSSGSIGSTNWGVITNGLAQAIGLIPTSGPDSYEVTVVTFGTNATTVLTPTVITAGNKAGVSAIVAAAPFLDSNTNYAAAFTLMTTDLTGSPLFVKSGKQYVNFATDGSPNTGGSGVTEFNAMITAGIDNVSVEGIGGGVNANLLKTSFCYPLACDDTSPFNFPSQGFYIGVANAQGYANAIGNKVRVVTNQVPEPGSLALAGLALTGLFSVRRRTKQA